MKVWYLLLGIIVCLIIVASPVVAISKSELLSQYKTGYFPGPTIPTPTPPFLSSVKPSVKPIPPIIPTTEPTQSPSGSGHGTLSVTSTPTGAPVYLDSDYKGITPVKITDISVGWHRLRVTLDGGIDQSTWIIITNWANSNEYHQGAFLQAHVTQQGIEVGNDESMLPHQCCCNESGCGYRGIEPQPTPTFGSLEISSSPSGANVYLDGNMWGNDGTFIGTTPFTTKVETGSHRLKLTKPGYSGARYTTPADTYYGNDAIDITVTEGMTVRVFAVLIPGDSLHTGRLL